MAIVIHSLIECKYCDLAKEFLTSINIPFTTIMYDKSADDYSERKDILISQTNCITFPQIFIQDRFIGGYQDLIHSYDTLQLHDLCKEIGITLEVNF
jgi:glutaredoxin